MVSSRGIGALASGAALAALGAVALAAWRGGLWGMLAGTALVIGWLLALGWREATRPHRLAPARSGASGSDDGLPLRLLLDQVPVPLLSLEAGAIRALNRAARALFATDDRVLPPPPALVDEGATHLLHETRRWRIDRVEAYPLAGPRAVVALVDVEVEERTAEARATAEMIQVLGHELLNGLAPIVSLAESGLTALDAPPPRNDLLREILGTLARRSEGLLRFTEAYRAMARLPEPSRSAIALSALADDLARLFAARWGDAVALCINVAVDAEVMIDRDQMTQAVWALLQNGAEAASTAGKTPRVGLTLQVEAGRLTIEVTDTGEGVTAGDTGRIFRPFHTTKVNGTGVGLSISRQVFHAHGGDLVLASLKPPVFRARIPAGVTHLYR